MLALMVVALACASRLVELMSVFRFIFAVMLVALQSVMRLCVVVFVFMLVVVMCALAFIVRVPSGYEWRGAMESTSCLKQFNVY